MFLLKTLASCASARRSRTNAYSGDRDLDRESGFRAIPKSGQAFSIQGFARSIICLLAFATLFAAPTESFGQSGRGTISGKVLNQATGSALSSARISVVGTSLSTVSEVDGSYRLRSVPAGEVELFVEYGSTSTQRVKVVVSDEQTVTRNVGVRLAGSELTASDVDNGIFELAPFEVQMQAEFNAQQLAVNEERYSNTIKQVVSADQFGDNTDGNIGEFVKFLPGMNVTYGGFDGGGEYSNGADATSIGIRGFGAEQTKIMVDGVEIAGSNPGSISTAVTLDMISVNNASRIEVTKLPTADMPDGAVGGSVNLVSRTAFEYPKAQFNWRTYIDVNSENVSDIFSKTPGPVNKETYKTIPGFDFSYVMPVNEKFGLSFNAQRSQKFNEGHKAQTDWNWDLNTQNPDGEWNDVTNPYFKRLKLTDSPRMSTRTSFGLKMDWRPLEGHSMSFNYTHSGFNGVDANRRVEIKPDRNGYDWGSNGDGSGWTQAIDGKGKISLDTDFLDREGSTNNYYLKYNIDRGPWRVDFVASTSRSRSSLESSSNGHFSVVELGAKDLGGMYLDNIVGGVPTIVELTSKSDYVTPWDPTDLSNFGVNGLSTASDGGSQLLVRAGQQNAATYKDTYKIDVARDLDFLSSDAVRVAFKAGFYRKEEENIKWGRGVNYYYRYTGPVDAFDASVYADTSYVNQDPGFGFAPFAWIDPYKIYDFYEENPNWFNDTEDVKIVGDTMAARNYQESVSASRGVTERTDAYYAKFDGKALNGKLGFDVGMRWSERDVFGYSQYKNKDWKYALDENGSMIYFQESWKDKVDENGDPVLDGNGDPVQVPRTRNVDLTVDNYRNRPVMFREHLLAAGYIDNVDDANNLNKIEPGTLAAKQLEYIKDYPINQKTKNDPVISAQASYEITDRITARVGYARTNGIPRYTNGVIKNTTEYDYPGQVDELGTIKIGNPGLEPWESEKFDYQLAYYTDLGGKIKVGYFVDETTNYIITDNFNISLDEATGRAEMAKLGIIDDLDFLGWNVETYRNGEGVSKTQGYEVEISQNLAFIGDWGKSINVWSNWSTKSTEKDEDTNLTDTPDSDISYGVAFRAGKFSGRVSAIWHDDLISKYKEVKRLTDITDKGSVVKDADGKEQKVQVYSRLPAETTVDVSLNYQINDKYGVFFSARNVTEAGQNIEIFDEEGYLPDWINMREQKTFGYNMQFGLRGSF